MFCNKWKRTPIEEQAPTEAQDIIKTDHVYVIAVLKVKKVLLRIR